MLPQPLAVRSQRGAVTVGPEALEPGGSLAGVQAVESRELRVGCNRSQIGAEPGHDRGVRGSGLRVVETGTIDGTRGESRAGSLEARHRARARVGPRRGTRGGRAGRRPAPAARPPARAPASRSRSGCPAPAGRPAPTPPAGFPPARADA